MRAADLPGRGLGQPEMPHLARLDQLGHCPTVSSMGVSGIDAMLVVEVDFLDAEAFQAGVAGGADVVGAAVDAEEGAVGLADVAELGRQDDLPTAAANGPAHEFLIPPAAVHVGGVEEGDAEVDGAMDGGRGLFGVPPAVEVRHAHAAQADGRDGKPRLAQGSRAHGQFLLM